MAGMLPSSCPRPSKLTLHSAIFQAGGLVVVVCEIFRRNFLASMVPVIVNAILNEHQLVIDIVCFVNRGDFHRSRLGEKQRGKILAGWVTRKMRSIAQYSIRDPGGDTAFGTIGEGVEPQPRASTGTWRTSGTGPGGPGSMKGSMRGSMLGLQNQMGAMSMGGTSTGLTEMPAGSGTFQGQSHHPSGLQQSFAPPPQPGVAEMPGQAYAEPAELGTGSIHNAHAQGDDTPTESRNLQDSSGLDFSFENLPSLAENPEQIQHQHQQYGAEGLNLSPAPLPAALRPGTRDGEDPPEPRFGSKPFLNEGQNQNYPQDQAQPQWEYAQQQQYEAQQQQYGQYGHHDQGQEQGERWGVPSQNQQYEKQHRQYDQGTYRSYDDWAGPTPTAGGGGGGGLRVANAHSDDRDRASSESARPESRESWAKEALMHMNFAGADPRV